MYTTMQKYVYVGGLKYRVQCVCDQASENGPSVHKLYLIVRWYYISAFVWSIWFL